MKKSTKSTSTIIPVTIENAIIPDYQLLGSEWSVCFIFSLNTTLQTTTMRSAYVINQVTTEIMDDAHDSQLHMRFRKSTPTW